MAVTITKTTNGHFKIDDPQNVTRTTYIPMSGSIIKSVGHDYVSIGYVDRPEAFKDHIDNITAPGNTSIGTCTFAHTTDRWTKATHTLRLGDRVMFSVVGTGATGYLVNTPYYVVTVVDANTFQLSETAGGSPLLSAADSAGTWTLVRYSATDRAQQIEALA